MEIPSFVFLGVFGIIWFGGVGAQIITGVRKRVKLRAKLKRADARLKAYRLTADRSAKVEEIHDKYWIVNSRAQSLRIERPQRLEWVKTGGGRRRYSKQVEVPAGPALEYDQEVKIRIIRDQGTEYVYLSGTPPMSGDEVMKRLRSNLWSMILALFFGIFGGLILLNIASNEIG